MPGAIINPLKRKNNLNKIEFTMKMKSNLIKTLALFVAALALNARADSGTITISGTVLAVATIGGTGTPVALTDTQLNGGVTDLLIATINEKSNKKTGYTVDLSSANAAATAQAKLIGASTGDAINYSLKYNGTAVVLVAGTKRVTDVNAATVAAGVNKTLQMTFAGGFPSADTYSDTLTLTLTNK